MTAAFLVASAFIASAVEFVEALTIVLAAGLMLVARESATAARVLDFADKHIHRFIQYLRRKWGHWSTAKRVMCAGTAGVLLAGAAAGAWFALAR